MALRHSLVIGGTRGLGREFVMHFRKAGHVVSVISRNAPSTSKDNGVSYFSADITDEQGFIDALRAAYEKKGAFDNVVLAQRFRGDEAWDGELSTTLVATRMAIEFAKDHFKPNGAKSIIVISSVAGRFFIDDQPLAYHLSKAALEHMVRYYAVVLGPKGIRVNGIAPCAFVKRESKKFYSSNKAIQKFYRTITPLGRMVTTQDIAHLAGFLADPRCFVTGQTILIDGGLSLLWPEAAAKRIQNPFLKAKRSRAG